MESTLDDEGARKIKTAGGLAKGLGWFWAIFGGVGVLYLIYLDIFAGFPVSFSILLGFTFFVPGLTGAYLVFAGKKILAYRENTKLAKQYNDNIFSISIFFLVVSFATIAIFGSGGSLGIILLGFLAYRAHKAKKVFDELELSV
jgi:hypothetical protein